MAVGQAEAEVGRAAGRIDLQFVTQAADEGEELCPGIVDGADRHHQRVDDDIGTRNAVIGGALDDLPRDVEPDVGVFGDAGLVI